jgi:hypothetical protein
MLFAKKKSNLIGKYLYCVAREGAEVPDDLTGMEKARLHAITVNGLSCIVSDAEFNDKAIDKESALVHERVLEGVMQNATIIPISFGHVARSEEDVRIKLLEAHKENLEEWLGNLEGKIELSLKAFWLDIKPVFAEISEGSEEIRRLKAKSKITRDDQMRAGEIAAQLFGKKREGMEAELIELMAPIAMNNKKCNLFGEQMIANLAFLIKKEDLEKFDARLNEYEEGLKDRNIMFKYAGPVPPFNFVDLKINLA